MIVSPEHFEENSNFVRATLSNFFAGIGMFEIVSDHLSSVRFEQTFQFERARALQMIRERVSLRLDIVQIVCFENQNF